jgi:hypothetical protein
MSITEINAVISVGAVFANGKVIPMWFKWKSDRLEVKEVKKTWSTAAEGVNTLHFSITGLGGYYELSFNQKTLVWVLEKTAEEE